MSLTNDIRTLIDIQDTNIIFEENCVQLGTYKNKTCKFIEGTLTYHPDGCEVCRIKNEHFTIYKNGTQTSRITLPLQGNYPTYLLLKKQRYFCKSCNHSFTAKTSIVKKHCHISKNVKAFIVVKAAEAQSLKSIAKDCTVSSPTVQRVINETAKTLKSHNQALPEHLSFDEFKYSKGKMAFEYINAANGDILDILEGRTQFVIKNHFMGNYSLVARKAVKTVTIDMNAGYETLITVLFPNADIIIDRFHLVQLINRSMNKTRIQVMNQLSTSDSADQRKYRRLKRYWKLLLKNEKDLSSVHYQSYSLFGQTTEAAIVAELLNYNPVLKANYRLYQDILTTMKDKNYNRLQEILKGTQDILISSYMKTSVKTLRKFLPYIENSFTYSYSNGRIEGINNKIKVLNRVAYGYRNFYHYKKRILIHFKFKEVADKPAPPLVG